MVETKTPTKTADKSARSGLGMVKAVPAKGMDAVIIAVISLIFFLVPIFFTGLVAQGIGLKKWLSSIS